MGKKLIAAGLVEHSDGSVLFARKAADRTHPLAGFFHLPYGDVKNYETAKDAVIRILRQKTGIEAFLQEGDAILGEVTVGEKSGLCFLCKPLYPSQIPRSGTRDVIEAVYILKAEVMKHLDTRYLATLNLPIAERLGIASASDVL